MNLLKLTETDKELKLSVMYSVTDGSYMHVIKKPFPLDSQLRKVAIGLRNLADHIDESQKE